MVHVLVIDPDPRSRQAVGDALEAVGHTVEGAASGRMALSHRGAAPDVVLLELATPDAEGLALCRAIRDDRSMGRAAICVISAEGDEDRRVAAFEAGADDYVARPYSMRELVLRVRALSRRKKRAAPYGEDWRLGELRIDRAARRVYVANAPIDLTRREFDVLACLAERAGRVQSRDALLPRVSEKGSESTRAIDTIIKRLRKKLSGSPTITTVRGVGYKLE
jgi:two-component system phosphate regulon response regulator PhoB